MGCWLLYFPVLLTGEGINASDHMEWRMDNWNLAFGTDTGSRRKREKKKKKKRKNCPTAKQRRNAKNKRQHQIN